MGKWYACDEKQRAGVHVRKLGFFEGKVLHNHSRREEDRRSVRPPPSRSNISHASQQPRPARRTRTSPLALPTRRPSSTASPLSPTPTPPCNQLRRHIALQRHRHKHNLRVRALRHSLESLQLPDLHRGGAGEYVGCLTHEACCVDFGAGGDDFGFTDTLLLGGGGERGCDFGGEDYVFDPGEVGGFKLGVAFEMR